MKDQDYIFVADEACISNDRFTVVGGVCMHKSTVDEVLANMREFRAQHNMNAELKWTKISRQKLAEYEKLVDMFFAMNNVNQLQFHCIIFDSHEWNHRRYNDGDRDQGISKLYYQLILHRLIKTCGHAGTCYVRLDHRNSSTSLEDLRRMLNSAANNQFGLSDNPLKHVASINSKECDILQLNDVILGAVAAARNGKHLLPNCNPAKQAIANRVLTKVGLEDYDTDTPRRISRFSVWNMRPRPRSG